MKIVKNFFLTLLALALVIAAGIFILFETFDPDQYLNQLTQKASSAIGRPVSIGHAGLGLSSRGITLDVWPLTVADDPAFTSEPFIKIDRVRISLDIKSLVLQRKIQITNILFQFPEVHFIRSEAGNMNVSSIGQRSRKNSAILINSGILKSPVIARSLKESVIASGAKQSFKFEKTAESPAISSTPDIKSITIQDASISYIDQSQQMPLDVWLLHINAGLKDVSLEKPVQLLFNASPLLSKGISSGAPDSPVFKGITGNAQLNLADLQNGTSGDISATDGIIKDFNIIKIIMSHIPVSFGNVADSINKLGNNDTIIEKAEAKLSLHDKAIFIDDSSIQTNIFELTAKGSLDQGANLDMQTTLHLNSDISAGLINQFEGLKYFCDDSKRIAVGGSLKGVIPHLKYKLDKDFKKKSKKAFNAMFRQLFGA